MKRKFLLIIVSTLFALNSFAQTEKALLFDEFGYIECDNYLARVQNVFLEQRNNPNSRVFIVVYEGRENERVYENGKFIKYRPVLPQFGLAKVRIESMKKWFALQNAPLENYVFVNGGFREDFAVEFWFVPPGAEAPKPTPTLEKMKYRKGKPKGFCLGCC